MLALSNISKFEGEKGGCKIFKPIWDVMTDYLLLFLLLLSITFGGMQVTSGTFECLAAVKCPGMSSSNMSSSFFINIKYRNVCEEFYSSRKTNVIEDTAVVTDLKSSFQYTNFVNSECSKSAVPNFLSYFGFFLFIQAFVLILLDNLWLKLPITGSVIESFSSLVMECYASPCPNFALTHALSDLPKQHHADNQKPEANKIEMANMASSNGNGKDHPIAVGNDESETDELITNVDKSEHDNPDTTDDNESDNDDYSILEDPATISAIKSLYEKVGTLKKNVKSSRKIWQLYLFQTILQGLFSAAFLFIDIRLMSDLQETMTCRLKQHIPVSHDYFICSHNLAPAFVLGLQSLYLPTLGSSLVVFFFIFLWMAKKIRKKFEYVFDNKRLPSLKATILSDLPAFKQDLGFLLHLLHSYNKTYVVRFAHFLSRKSKKKIQTFYLKRKYPVGKLNRQLKENGNGLTFTNIQGIPETIFKLSRQIITLELTECKLQHDDFERFKELNSLRKLLIIECRLKSIPGGILNIKLLEVLSLKGNFLKTVTKTMSELQNLTTLDLSNNNLETIETESCENLANLLTVDLSGNSKLKMEAIKVVLKCERLRILHSPPHISARKSELDPLEKKKFDAVSGTFVIPYTPEDVPHIDLEDREKIYKMDTRPKGLAIIINNYSYKHLPSRIGSDKDVTMLKTVLEKIGFITQCCIDYTATKAKELVDEGAKNETYKDCSCIVVVVMSHGDEKGLIFPGYERLDIMRFVKSVQMSPLYQEKPKLFFIQACRGYKHARGFDGTDEDSSASASTRSSALVADDGVVADVILRGNEGEEATDSSPGNVMTELPTIPEGADILLAYSTMDGYTSMRNLNYGSWYVQALVETFCEHAWEEDILSLLTLVNYKVVGSVSQTGWRQIPAPQSTLRKKLYLLPGYSSEPRSDEPQENKTYA